MAACPEEAQALRELARAAVFTLGLCGCRVRTWLAALRDAGCEPPGVAFGELAEKLERESRERLAVGGACFSNVEIAASLLAVAAGLEAPAAE
jgi:hypothetical protein